MSNVKTAAKNKGMTKLGLSNPFSIRLDGIKTEFKIEAIMIKELADDINLGNGFLQKAAAYGIDTRLIFHPKGTTLSMGRETIELVSKMATSKKLDQAPKESNQNQ